MILVVNGISNVSTNLKDNNNSNHFQHECYNVETKEQLNKKVKIDFDTLLNAEKNKLQIDVLI